MNKYKIKFKGSDDALDDKKDFLYNKTLSFLEQRYSTVQGEINRFLNPNAPGWIHQIFFYFKDENAHHKEYGIFRIYVEAMTVAKSNTSTNKYIPFNSSELKFFDMLGLEVHPEMFKQTGQDITDWWQWKEMGL